MAKRPEYKVGQTDVGKLMSPEEFADAVAKARITFSKIRRAMDIATEEATELAYMLGIKEEATQ